MKLFTINPALINRKTVTGVKHAPDTTITGKFGLHQNLPVELHLIPNGAIDEGPSVALISMQREKLVASQASMEMMIKAFKEIGYTLSKDESN